MTKVGEGLVVRVENAGLWVGRAARERDDRTVAILYRIARKCLCRKIYYV